MWSASVKVQTEHQKEEKYDLSDHGMVAHSRWIGWAADIFNTQQSLVCGGQTGWIG